MKNDKRISPYVFLSEYTIDVNKQIAWQLDTNPELVMVIGEGIEIFDVIYSNFFEKKRSSKA